MRAYSVSVSVISNHLFLITTAYDYDYAYTFCTPITAYAYAYDYTFCTPIAVASEMHILFYYIYNYNYIYNNFLLTPLSRHHVRAYFVSVIVSVITMCVTFPEKVDFVLWGN